MFEANASVERVELDAPKVSQHGVVVGEAFSLLVTFMYSGRLMLHCNTDPDEVSYGDSTAQMETIVELAALLEWLEDAHACAGGLERSLLAYFEPLLEASADSLSKIHEFASTSTTQRHLRSFALLCDRCMWTLAVVKQDAVTLRHLSSDSLAALFERRNASEALMAETVTAWLREHQETTPASPTESHNKIDLKRSVLFTAGAGAIRAWSVASRTCLLTLDTPQADTTTSGVRALAMLIGTDHRRDKRWWLASAVQSIISIWDLRHGGLLVQNLVEVESSVSVLMFVSSTSAILASGCEDGSLRLWDADSGDCVLMLSDGGGGGLNPTE